jgi:hypothetical protein
MFRLLPAWALALSLNGFFLYLGALDVLGIAPRTAVTAAWYALVGLLCLLGAWMGRERLVARLRRAPRPTAAHVLAGAALAAWFLLNVALLTDGTLPRKLAALLVLWSLPTALLALSLGRQAVERAAAAIAALGCVFVGVELLAILAGRISSTRFSPIAYLDPISAAQYPALGALALLVLRPKTLRGEVLRAVGVALLVAGAVLPGSRGPILALVLGLVVLAYLGSRNLWRLALPAAAVGLALGAAGTTVVGSSYYLTYSLPGGSSGASGPVSGEEGPPISTLSIRREWWTAAAKALPDDPIVGHGVAMFVDDTPEAHRMKIAGQRTYPHNSPLEAAYSLGLLGALPYAVWLGAGLVAVILLVRRRRPGPVLLVAPLWAFAFVSATFSGEIGADASLWAAGALAAALYADTVSSK